MTFDPATAQHTLTVDLADRRYDILIGSGLLDQAGTIITPLLAAPRVVIISDETVHGLHGAALETSLKTAGITLQWVILPSGEAQKSFNGLKRVLEALFKAGFDRKDTVIAFGGGVIGDLTGFAASIFKRGCRFIQIPTTLLAQVDSSVGGKTAINSTYGKNLIGAFYQPRLVLADMQVLGTLPERELKAGYAEVLKYGLLGDVSFFNWLEDEGPDVLALRSNAAAHAVARACQTKASIVAADEYETGQRALLNLGHTFAHALELQAGYSGDILHGEAVSAGMEMAFEFSTAQGLCPAPALSRVQSHLAKCGLTQIKDVTPLLADPDALIAHMDQDKKNEGGALTLILIRAIGQAFVQKAAPRDAVYSYLKTLTERYHD